jgi:hypothetical protein
MEDVVPKTKTFSKPFIPQKNKDKNPFQKEGMGKEKMDEATCNELRRKNFASTTKTLGSLDIGVWVRERNII